MICHHSPIIYLASYAHFHFENRQASPETARKTIQTDYANITRASCGNMEALIIPWGWFLLIILIFHIRLSSSITSLPICSHLTLCWYCSVLAHLPLLCLQCCMGSVWGCTRESLQESGFYGRSGVIINPHLIHQASDRSQRERNV